MEHRVYISQKLSKLKKHDGNIYYYLLVYIKEAFTSTTPCFIAIIERDILKLENNPDK